MTWLAALLFILSCGVIGWAALRALDLSGAGADPQKVGSLAAGTSLGSGIVVSCLAFGLGAAVVSYSFFVTKWAFPTANYKFAYVFLLIVALVTLSRQLHKKPTRRFQPAWPPVVFTLLLFTAIGVSAYVALMQVRALPYGEWDAWAIWNLHARFLFRGGEDWHAMFSPSLSWAHPDYPLFLPALVAAGWSVIGNESTSIPTVLTLLFSAAVIALLVGALRSEGEWVRPLMAALVLISTPKFWQNGTIQTADVPVAFFILLTVILLWRADCHAHLQGRLLALAGATAALAAWTKNEAILFFVALAAVRIVFRFAAVGFERAAKEFAFWGAGAAPGLLVLTLFKVILAPPSEFASAFTAERIFDIVRYTDVLRLMARYARVFAGDTGFNAAWLLLPALVTVGARLNPEARRPLSAFGGLILLMLAGYSLLYQITPNPLEWHIYSSFDRLLLQIWPAFVFAIFASLQPRPGDDLIRGWPWVVAPLCAGILAFYAGYRTLPSDESTVQKAESKLNVTRISPNTSLVPGWARVELKPDSSDAIWMKLSLRSVDSVAEVVTRPVQPASSGVIPVLDRGGVGIAMVNPNPVPASVSAWCDQQQISFTIPARGKTAAMIGDSPFDFRGCQTAVHFESTVDIGTQAFLSAEGGLTEVSIALSGRGDASESLHIPYVAEGLYRAPELVLVNPGAVTITGRFRWLDSKGSVLASGGYEVGAYSTDRILLQPPSTLARGGRVEITPEGGVAPNASVILNGPVAVKGIPAATNFVALVESDSERRLQSALVLVNPNTTAARVDIITMGEKRSVDIPPMAQVIQNGFGDSILEIARIESSLPIVITVVRSMRGRLLSVAEAIQPRSEGSRSTALFPQVVTERGYTSEVVLEAPAEELELF